MRRHALPLVLLALAAVTLFAPALVQREVFTLRDHFDYFQPLRFFTAEELREGRLPFWNPYNASGEPWLANPQTGVFYPPAWLFLVLPFETAYMLFLLLHLLVLGWGAYLLFARGASQGAAMVGAIALMFSGPVLSLLDVQNNLATLAWVPLALWCAAEGAWRRGGAMLALAFLGGEPFFAAVAAVMYGVVQFLGVPRIPRVPRRGEADDRAAGPLHSEELRGTPRNRGTRFVSAALVAFGLTAIQLLPFLEYVATSDRAGGMEDSLVLRDSMSLLEWSRIAVTISGARSQQFIPVVYMGLGVVVLAAVGASTARRNRAARGWLVLLASAFAISLGPGLLAQMPVTLFRYPARLVPIAALAVAGLAVIGWERARGGRRWADLLIVLVLVADLLPASRPLLQTGPFRRDVVPYPPQVGGSAKLLRFGEVDPQHRARWIAGYLNLYERRFDAFTAAPLTSERYVRLYRDLLGRPTPDNFARAGIVYVVTRRALPPPWVRAAGEGDVHVFRTVDAFPMAAHVAPGSNTLRHARWTVSTSDARVTVNAPRDGMLVLRQQAGRGWSVTVDGTPAEPLVVEGVFRGVSVPKGRHEIVWTYRPPLFAAGAAITIATLLALALSLVVARVRAARATTRFTA